MGWTLPPMGSPGLFTLVIIVRSNVNLVSPTHCAQPTGTLQTFSTGRLLLLSSVASYSSGEIDGAEARVELGSSDARDDVFFVVDVSDPPESIHRPLELGVLRDRGGPLLAGLVHVILCQFPAGLAGDGIPVRPIRLPQAFHRYVAGAGADGFDGLREEQGFRDADNLRLVVLLGRLLPESAEVECGHAAAADLAFFLRERGYVLCEVVGRDRVRIGQEVLVARRLEDRRQALDRIRPSPAVDVVRKDEADLPIGLELLPTRP